MQKDYDGWCVIVRHQDNLSNNYSLSKWEFIEQLQFIEQQFIEQQFIEQ